MRHQFETDRIAIYRQSFAIIRAEADLARFTPTEELAVVRMIHATGMVGLEAHVRFTDGMAAAARTALEAGAPILTLTYMYTSDISFELYAGLPYEHDVEGAGTIKGVGKIATIKQVSPTLFAQYRFLEKESMVRPYVGLGLTYGYFFGEEGSAALTALTNPGGPPTTMSASSSFGLSPQVGLSFRFSDRWFLDGSVIKTFVKNTTTLSTGQKIDTKLDPLSTNISVGYRF